LRQQLVAQGAWLSSFLRGWLLGPGPARRGHGLLALASAATCLVCLVLMTTYPWGRDQSIYAVLGHGLLRGQVPYRDLWDFKPPGIFFAYAAAEAWFGKSMTSIRWLEIGGHVVSILCSIVLARRLQGSALAGWFAGAIMMLAYTMLDFWHTAQPETFGGMLTVVALTLVVPRVEHTTSRVNALIAGVLIGGAGLMKPQLSGALIVFGAYVLRQNPEAHWKRRVLPLAALLAGALATALACAAYFILRDAWSDLWWTLRHFVPGYTALGWHAGQSPLGMFHFALVELLTKFSVYVPVGIAAALILPSAHSREHEGLFLVLGLVVFHAVGIALQAKFFQYHYGATLPLAALMAGFGWAKLWWTAVARGWAQCTLFALAALVAGLTCTGVPDLPGSGWQRAQWRFHLLLRGSGDATARERLDSAIARVAGFDLAADREVATWIKGQTGPDETVLVWGFEPAIYWFAERRPATRFIYNVPQRTAWQRAVARRRFMDDILRAKPAVVVVQHADIFPSVTGKMNDSAADLADFPEFAVWLDSNYHPAGYRFNFEYFRRLP